MNINRAGTAHLKGIEDCVKQAYCHYEQRLGCLPAPMRENYAQVLEEKSVFVALEEGIKDVLGVLVLAQTPEGFLLDNIAVAPKAQGRGVGKRLLALAEQQALAAGFTSIYLYTNVKMQENRDLYQRMGYQEYDLRNEQGLSRVYLRKSL
ncbi:GNAT family N-acetyltransferase [Marinomonas transparens]|uniref:GNAT family N-acetyltransferase n=1 Tax=Marinomonas transparens TaxID=2795388 RepID=A0A934JNZ0_9GAMM|nr:GNAT family N-acetyltransferase [Marinomonas transparens]MBJ7537449.1 GNAT family N-acetyltransferase [Marinomonas transparens]